MKKEIFYTENTILDITYNSFFKEDILENALFKYIRSKYPEFTEVDLDYIDDRSKIDLILQKLNIGGFIILDKVDSLGNNDKFIFELQQKNSIINEPELINDRNLLWLSGYRLSEGDNLLFNSLREGTKHSAILKITKGNFTSYLDEGAWHCPIEYYLKWKVEHVGKENAKKYDGYKELKGVYDGFNNVIKNNSQINGFLKYLDMKYIYLSNKEKFARWVYEGMFFIDLEEKYIRVMEYENESKKDIFNNLLKTIYILFDDYVEEYISICPFTNMEDVLEVKRRIRRKLYH